MPAFLISKSAQGTGCQDGRWREVRTCGDGNQGRDPSLSDGSMMECRTAKGRLDEVRQRYGQVRTQERVRAVASGLAVLIAKDCMMEWLHSGGLESHDPGFITQ